MEALLKTIKDNRGVRDTTLKMYKTQLNRLSNSVQDKDYDSKKFLVDDQKKVLEFLSDKSNSVKKKYLASIMIALSPDKKNSPSEGDSKAYNKYKNMLNTENGIYLDSVRDNNKSDRDKKNWTTLEELNNVKNKILKKIKGAGYNFKKSKGVDSKKDFFLIQDYLIASLYLNLPPRRLDYSDMTMVSQATYNDLSENEKENNNYLVNVNKSRKFFSFGKDNSKSETDENIIIQVPKNMNDLINYWGRINKTKHLLVSRNGGKLTKNALSKQLVDIFKPTGKNISVVMLRKIYLSEKFSDKNKEQQEIAEKMNHSVSVANTFYVKN
jgi:hypothetical protein